LEINLIIRELLAKHNFISLPTLGSFIQKYEPAHQSPDGKGFISPKQNITFDDSRTFNDEAIENYLCENMGITHSNASKLLTEFVNRIKEELNNGKIFVFENVGKLSKGKKGEILFEQAKDLDVALSTYGLNDIEVTETIKAKAVKPKTIPKVAPQPISSKSEGKSQKKSFFPKVLMGLSGIIAIAVLTATFILIPELRFWEEYINTNNTKVESKTDSLQRVENKLSQVKSQPDSTCANKDSLINKIDQTIAVQNDKKAALYYEEPKIQENKTFYIIVGSFGKIENAQKLAEKYIQKGFDTEIVQGNAMYRVSVKKFTDKNLALSEFNKFHRDYPNESVWLLGI